MQYLESDLNEHFTTHVCIYLMGVTNFIIIPVVVVGTDVIDDVRFLTEGK